MRLDKMGSFTAAMRGLLLRVGLLVVLASMACAQNTDPFNLPRDNPDMLPPSPGNIRYYDFDVRMVNYTVNCRTKEIVTVNGMFPGPIIYANEGDRVIVNVTNNSNANMTIHFHGTRQYHSTWMDGVAYITMCPIQPGDYFTHDFMIVQQQGTLLWHAHIAWQRATNHGAFITYPAQPYPFPHPHEEVPIVLAEWWYEDVEEVETNGLNNGQPFPVSDAMTINGHPGITYNCSATEGYTVINAKYGKTYLLRIINAALNAHLFFSVANHTMTVVEADGAYTFPFETSVVFLSPGQTTNVLITASQPGGTYLIQVQGYGRDNIPIVRPAALFKYKDPSPLSPYPFSPVLPVYNNTGVAYAFDNSLRTLYPGRVPLTVNRNLFLTVGLSERVCGNGTLPLANNCSANFSSGLRYQGAVNNITFKTPTIDILQASYYNIPGVFTEDFPDNPPHTFDYTNTSSPPPVLRISNYGTRIIPITFNDTVQVVLQDTMILGFEDHPFHLHGQNFYVLGQGFGNFDPTRDTNGLNLYDPPLRNTVSVPTQGWAVIRIKMNNPGVWLFHCHLDKHTSWGMEAVFHVHNGIGPNNSYNPPPNRLVAC
ncbi:unnamed protein product [Calypogeia fissa]